jgi:hypothetical protein
MFEKIFKYLKTKKNIEGKEWYTNARLAQSGVSTGINYNR